VPELPEVETARRLIAAQRRGNTMWMETPGVGGSAEPGARHPGGSCPRCGAEMVHGAVGGRSTCWCSREQAAWPDAA
jgi:formamidopyrimidine-DNA glycosylase